MPYLLLAEYCWKQARCWQRTKVQRVAVSRLLEQLELLELGLEQAMHWMWQRH